MLQYAPPAFRPAVTSPTMRRQAPRFVLGQQFEQFFGWPPAAGDALRLIFHTGSSAVGYYVWFKGKGFWRWLGLFLAVGQTVGAICDTMSLIQRITGTHPPESPPPPAPQPPVTAPPNA